MHKPCQLSGADMKQEKPRIQVQGGEYRIDAWRNEASGMGVPGMDKTLYGRFGIVGRLDPTTLSFMYRYDWLARKICDRPASDAVRRWIKIDGDNEDALNAELERLGAKQKIKKAIAWSRLYGGAAIILIVEDGRTPADPIDWASVRKVVDLKVADRYRLQPQGRIVDPYSVGFGEPEFYALNNGTIFHHSRVLRFNGAELTQDDMEKELWWGGSYVELYSEAVRAFQASMQDIRYIMTESSIGTLKIPGLTQANAMGGSIFNAIQARLDKFNMSKSIYRTAAMDKEEEFQFTARNLTGLSDLLDRFMTQVSAATELGELVLFGTSPAGLNASQEEQLASYDDVVRGIQEGDEMLAINAITACLNGGEVPQWDYCPLREMSDTQKADVRLKEAQALQAVADIVALTSDEARKHLNHTGHFDLEEDVDADWQEGLSDDNQPES